MITIKVCLLAHISIQIQHAIKKKVLREIFSFVKEIPSPLENSTSTFFGTTPEKSTCIEYLVETAYVIGNMN